MGQYWKLFNLDRREQFYIESPHKLGEFFFRSSPGRHLKELLSWPADSACMIGWIEREILSGLKAAKTDEAQANSESIESSETLMLDQLPNEILHSILDFNDDLEDAILFSLTCRHFWEIGKYHVMRIRDGLIRNKTWAGTRVICGGDYQDDNDWPSSISEEAYKSYRYKDDWPDRVGDSRTLPYQYYARSYNLKPVENTILGYLCEDYQMGTIFVLRNLSKKVYMVEDDFDKLFEGYEETKCERITLGHIAFAHICWSSSLSTSMSYGGPIHRGEWAGDRLEIVPKAQHMQEVEEAAKASQELEGVMDQNATGQSSSTPVHLTDSECGWKDVTEECMKLIEDIWKAEYGEDWRKVAFRPG